MSGWKVAAISIGAAILAGGAALGPHAFGVANSSSDDSADVSDDSSGPDD